MMTKHMSKHKQQKKDLEIYWAAAHPFFISPNCATCTKNINLSEAVQDA
jgi:hypothetical protein